MSRPNNPDLPHEPTLPAFAGSPPKNAWDDFEVRDLTRFELNEHWFFRFLDRNFKTFTGHDPEDFLSGRKCLLDIVHDQDRVHLEQQFDAGLVLDHYYSARFRIRGAEGEPLWVFMRGQIAEGASGKSARIRGIISYMLPEDGARLEELRNRDFFSSFANVLEEKICIIGDDHRIKFMNKAMIEAIGNRVGETCCKTLVDSEDCCTIPSELVQNWGACFFRKEIKIAGSDKVFEVRSMPVIMDGGMNVRITQFRDVSRLKKIEQTLRNFAIQVRSISKAADMAQLGIFIILDTDEREAQIRFTNNAFCRIVGYTEAELLNMSLSEVIHPDDVEQAMGRYRRRLQGEPMRDTYEIKLLRKDQSFTTVFVMGALSMYYGKVATVGFVRDVTFRKQLQESLYLSQRLAAIGKLSAELAHEISNPLTSVITFNKLIERIIQQQPFPVERLPELQDYVRFVNNEAGRCADIAKNLLDFSRNTEIRVAEHDINQILDKSLGILTHRAELRNIEIRTAYSRELPLIQCDFNRMQQAFINILWNAIEAMPDGGVLSVTTCFEPQPPCQYLCKAEKSVIQVSISDTGVGIPPEDLDRIFEPFFSTKTETSGVGLGLSVAYGIISKHNGRIRVKSEPGAGTCFLVDLFTEKCSSCSLIGC